MEATQFNLLTLPEKELYLKNHGKFITEVPFHSYSLKLYKADEKLYEVWFAAKDQSIQKIEAIPNNQQLPNYLKRVNLAAWL